VRDNNIAVAAAASLDKSAATEDNAASTIDNAAAIAVTAVTVGARPQAPPSPPATRLRTPSTTPENTKLK
jgi:hypothetical protein